MINKRKDILKKLIFIIKKYCKIEYREDLPLFGKLIFNLISFKNKKRIRFIIYLRDRKVYFFYKKKEIHLRLIKGDSFKIDNRLLYNVDKWLYRNTL